MFSVCPCRLHTTLKGGGGGEGGTTAKRLVRANNFVNDCSKTLASI